MTATSQLVLQRNPDHIAWQAAAIQSSLYGAVILDAVFHRAFMFVEKGPAALCSGPRPRGKS
jgi:hypothetical protein